MTNLNLGCGEMILDDYINCDLYNPKADIINDARVLPYGDNSIDKIYASHLIEHFDFKEAFNVLNEWKRCLKVDGILDIETPDLLASCKKFVNISEQERVNMYSHFFSEPWVEGQVHKFLYTPNQMKWTLDQVGFRDIKQEPAKCYIDREDICMRFVCRKIGV